MRKPLIDNTNTVINIIEIEPDASYVPPAGLTMLDPNDNAAIGGTYNPTTKTFTPPPGPTPPAE